MELIENESTAQGVLPEPEPRYHTASLPTEKTEHGQSIIQILAAVLGGLILIILIVLLARWIYHKAHHASVATPTPSTSQKTPATSYNNNTSGAQPSSGSSSVPATNNPASSTPSNTQITNTGPGDVAAIFAGVTLAAAGLHYIISLRRFSRGQS